MLRLLESGLPVFILTSIGGKTAPHLSYRVYHPKLWASACLDQGCNGEGLWSFPNRLLRHGLTVQSILPELEKKKKENKTFDSHAELCLSL